MNRKINCKFNNSGAWCININIKCSLFGLGARCCSEFYDIKKCELKQSKTKPAPPPPPKNREIHISGKSRHAKE
jgi:hypothetical protein